MVRRFIQRSVITFYIPCDEFLSQEELAVHPILYTVTVEWQITALSL